jgi:CheY-like chemotaxis protein
VRYSDLDAWSDLYDAAVPEATARETVARRLCPPGEGVERRPVAGPRPRVAVVGTNAALRPMLAEAIVAAGYPVVSVRGWNEAPETGPAVWDIPLLEPDWPQALARRGGVDPVVALIGFADRALVAEARARGASACLELPLDLADLVAALDRLTAPRVEPAHALPPAPATRRCRTRAVADAGCDA